MSKIPKKAMDLTPRGKKRAPAWPMSTDYQELELSIRTSDGYTFTSKPDGSIGDGDLSWPSLQAFLDSHK